jgi:phosphoribosylanthranilate isomerase
MITQIYQVSSANEALLLSEVGVDLIGLVVNLNTNIPGLLNIDEAVSVIAGVKGNSKSVILPFTSNLQEIGSIIQLVNPDIIHIASDPQDISPQDLVTLKNQFRNMKFMRTIPVIDDSSIQMAKQYDRVADYLLLDTKVKNQTGVTGITHDWKISKKIVEEVSTPVILAGGLGADNVQQAISVVNPYGVDSKTKTDVLGTNQKDIEKVKQFVRLTKSGKN